MRPAKSVWGQAVSCEFPVDGSIGAGAIPKRERSSMKNRRASSIRSLLNKKLFHSPTSCRDRREVGIRPSWVEADVAVLLHAARARCPRDSRQDAGATAVLTCKSLNRRLGRGPLLVARIASHTIAVPNNQHTVFRRSMQSFAGYLFRSLSSWDGFPYRSHAPCAGTRFRRRRHAEPPILRRSWSHAI